MQSGLLALKSATWSFFLEARRIPCKLGFRLLLFLCAFLACYLLVSWNCPVVATDDAEMGKDNADKEESRRCGNAAPLPSGLERPRPITVVDAWAIYASTALPLVFGSGWPTYAASSPRGQESNGCVGASKESLEKRTEHLRIGPSFAGAPCAKPQAVALLAAGCVSRGRLYLLVSLLREELLGLDISKYMEEWFGKMPISIQLADFLQLRPATQSL